MKKLTKEVLGMIERKEIFCQCPICGILCKTRESYMDHAKKHYARRVKKLKVTNK